MPNEKSGRPKPRDSFGEAPNHPADAMPHQRERTALRDNLESIAVAILLVLLVRQIVVEAFRIRHGSMAPTLVGEHKEIRCPNCGWVFNVGADKAEPSGEVQCPNCRYLWAGAIMRDEQGQPLTARRPEWLWLEAVASDGRALARSEVANRVLRGPARVFVNKFVYQLRAPRRWEVVVFLYPYVGVRCRTCDWIGELPSSEPLVCPTCGSKDLEVERRNFIKRVVGLPNEDIELKDGDVYVNGRIARKPPGIQEELWMHVFDSRFYPQRDAVPLWEFQGAEWQINRRSGQLRVDARGAVVPAIARFAAGITDFYAYDGPSYEVARFRYGAAGRNTVGDCRVRALVRALAAGSTGGEVVLEIQDAGHRLSLSVPVSKGEPMLLDDELPVRRITDAQLGLGQPEWITLENYDDRAVAVVGSSPPVSYDYEGRPSPSHGLRLEVRNAEVVFERIIIERDIYYLQDNGAPGGLRYRTGADEYFVLGDNSPASSDSRRWRRPGVPGQNMVGKAFLVFWPVHQMKWLGFGAEAEK